MPSAEMVKLWTAMLTTVPGWILLVSMLMFFAFIGFKIFIGTYSERLLSKVVVENHKDLKGTIERLVSSFDGLARAIEGMDLGE